MKALVTGGAGFVGSNICAALARRGDEVVVVDDLSSGYAENIADLPGVTLMRGDIRDRTFLDKAIQGCEVVFHLAASVGNKRSIDHPQLDTEINAMGTMNVLQAARSATVRKLVLSSSAGIYGELKTIPIKEDHPIDPLTPYAVSKLYAEKMALAFSHVYGIEAIALRYFNVYGPNQRFDAYGNVIPIFVFKALRGENMPIFGDGLQTRDFIHVDDVVQANLAAGDNRGISGAFNIGSATQISILDLARAVNAQLDKSVLIEHFEPRPGDVAHSLADIGSARNAFGFQPRKEFEEGLASYMSWARKETHTRLPSVNQ